MEIVSRSTRQPPERRGPTWNNVQVDKRTKNHINSIEDFWSYAKHILYNYRGVSKYHFPMYLKEVEYRFNHRKENLFKSFLNIYFGYVSN